MKRILITLLALIIINCGGSTTSNEVTAITIGSKGNEMKYDTTEFTVSAGATVKLTMKNNASMENMIHNVVIILDESAVTDIVRYAEMNGGNPIMPNSDILAVTSLADLGEEVSVEFIAPKKPGRYLYICTYTAHAATMRGYMIVE